jgi:hypothetical protein
VRPAPTATATVRPRCLESRMFTPLWRADR